MDSAEYHAKLSKAKSQAEREKINDEFMKQRRSVRKKQTLRKFCTDNLFDIINAIITLLALIVAILSLLLQLQGN